MMALKKKHQSPLITCYDNLTLTSARDGTTTTCYSIDTIKSVERCECIFNPVVYVGSMAISNKCACVIYFNCTWLPTVQSLGKGWATCNCLSIIDFSELSTLNCKKGKFSNIFMPISIFSTSIHIYIFLI